MGFVLYGCAHQVTIHISRPKTLHLTCDLFFKTIASAFVYFVTSEYDSYNK